MSGIHLKANMVFANSTAPVIPDQLPVAGVYRSFVANSLRLPVGAKIAAWQDDAGSGTFLTPAGADAGASAPTLVETSFVRAASFNGAGQKIGQALGMAQPYTLAMVFRCYEITAAVNNIILTGNPNFFIDGTPNWRWNLGGGSIAAIPGADTAWHVLLATGNGASSIFNIDGTEVAAAGPQAFQKLSVGHSFRGFVSRIDVFNRALDFTERAELMGWLMARKP